MDHYAKIKKFFENDRFVKFIGIQIDSIQDGEAVCSMPIEEYHLNAGNSVQGGAVFTLADFAFAVAAGSCNRVCVSLNSTISYLRPPQGKRLLAHAKKISQTRHTCVYEVNITDDMKTKVAYVVATSYVKDIVIVPHEEEGGAN